MTSKCEEFLKAGHLLGIENISPIFTVVVLTPEDENKIKIAIIFSQKMVLNSEKSRDSNNEFLTVWKTCRSERGPPLCSRVWSELYNLLLICS